MNWRFLLEFLKFGFTLGFFKNVKKRKKNSYSTLTVKNYFAFALQKTAMAADQKICNKSLIFYPIYDETCKRYRTFFLVYYNNSKNDLKNRSLVAMCSIYFLVVEIYGSLKNGGVYKEKRKILGLFKIKTN